MRYFVKTYHDTLEWLSDNVSPMAERVYHRIRTFENEECGTVDPSVETIAKSARITRRYCHTCIEELVSAGAIKREKKKGKRTEYSVVPLNELCSTDHMNSRSHEQQITCSTEPDAVICGSLAECSTDHKVVLCGSHKEDIDKKDKIQDTPCVVPHAATLTTRTRCEPETQDQENANAGHSSNACSRSSLNGNSNGTSAPTPKRVVEPFEADPTAFDAYMADARPKDFDEATTAVRKFLSGLGSRDATYGGARMTPAIHKAIGLRQHLPLGVWQYLDDLKRLRRAAEVNERARKTLGEVVEKVSYLTPNGNNYWWVDYLDEWLGVHAEPEKPKVHPLRVGPGWRENGSVDWVDHEVEYFQTVGGFYLEHPDYVRRRMIRDLIDGGNDSPTEAEIAAKVAEEIRSQQALKDAADAKKAADEAKKAATMFGVFDDNEEPEEEEDQDDEPTDSQGNVIDDGWWQRAADGCH